MDIEYKQSNIIDEKENAERERERHSLNFQWNSNECFEIRPITSYVAPIPR